MLCAAGSRSHDLVALPTLPPLPCFRADPKLTRSRSALADDDFLEEESSSDESYVEKSGAEEEEDSSSSSSSEDGGDEDEGEEGEGVDGARTKKKPAKQKSKLGRWWMPVVEVSALSAV